MKELIKQIIKEETSTQTKLMTLIKKFGVDYGAKAVGGYGRLNKIMKGTDFLYVKIDAGPEEIHHYISGDRR